MAIAIRSYKITFKAYCDPEAYNGFNLALCYSTDTPLTNPIRQVYIKPAYSAAGTYEYTFKDQMMDLAKTYTVFVQVVSFGKDSSWKNIAGFQCPDDGVGTVGGGVTEEELQDIIDDGGLTIPGDIIISIDGSKTVITNIDGTTSIVNGTINVHHLNVGTIVGNTAFLQTLVVDGIATITEAWIGGVHIKDNTITADKVEVRDLVVNGIANITEAWIGGVHIKDNTIDAGKINVTDLVVNGIANLQESWIDGVHIKDNAITADKVEVRDLAVNGLATITEAWIGGAIIKDDSITVDNIASKAITADKIDVGELTGNNAFLKTLTVDGISKLQESWIDGVHIKNGVIEAPHISAGSIYTEHLSADSITSEKIKSDSIESRHIKAGEIEATKINTASLTAKLATIGEAWISGVHIKNSEITAEKVNTFDLASKGLANLNYAYVTESNIGLAAINSAHIKTASIDSGHIKDAVIDMAKIANILSSTNYIANTTGWQIRKDGTAEFCGGVKVANWIIAPDVLKSKETGNRIELNSLRNRVSIHDSTTTKVAIGYLENLQKFDIDGNYLPGQYFGSSDYGIYVAPGNKLGISGDSEFSNGDWTVKHDGAYKILNADSDVIVKLGTESGETGLFCYDEFGNIISALTNDRFEVGNIATGTGFKYDPGVGLNIVGSIKITVPVDTSGITVPNPSNIGVTLL